jgi:broad specificity phosphatase PhoE
MQPPRIIAVRHAQGFHNLGNYTLPDPALTPLGEEQCETLRTTQFPDQNHISLVAASPLTRTLHTSMLVFKDALRNSSGKGKCKPQILAIPDAQETSDCLCDTGSDLDVLTAFCKDQDWPVDLSLLTPTWNVKTLSGRYSPHSDAIAHRAKAVRQLLRRRARELASEGDDEVTIVLVAHGGLMHYLTGDWEGADKYPGTGWFNCEARTYVYAEDVMSDDEDASLVETTESRQKRGLTHPMGSKAEQVRLFEEAMSGWERQGLQRPDKLDIASEETEEELGPLQREVTRRESMGIERRPSVVKERRPSVVKVGA